MSKVYLNNMYTCSIESIKSGINQQYLLVVVIHLVRVIFFHDFVVEMVFGFTSFLFLIFTICNTSYLV